MNMPPALLVLLLTGTAAGRAAPPGEATPAPPRASPAAVPAPTRTHRTRPTDVSSTRHNLSITGQGAAKALTESRVCFFCHGSHTGGATGNRPEPMTIIGKGAVRRLGSQPMVLSGGSRMCLSCHDGSVALGQTLRGRVGMRAEALAKRGTGLDLRRSHPVGIQQATGLALRRPEREEAVQLDRRGSVECTTCHDPHREDADPGRKFLVASNDQSALCLSCHVVPGWAGGRSAHRNSPRPFAAGAGPARPIADLACASCHVSHEAAERGPLLRPLGVSEDDLCTSCHDGRVASNVAAELVKPSAHSAARNGPVHDHDEGRPGAPHPIPEVAASAPRHATCVDCHDPHSAEPSPQRAPFAPGALTGVWGIDRNGRRVSQVRYEYEVCLKCHGDSANKPQARGLVTAASPLRRKPDHNLRQVFGASAVSSHPVMGPGKGTDVPSLRKPLSTASVIYCSDCHGSDSSGSPRGPHGSIYPKLLAAPLSTADGTPEGPGAYGLCYRCHDREVLFATDPQLSDDRRSAFPRHRRYVVELAVPCTACHNPHGVSALSGTARNNAHLVDFDTGIVKTNTAGLLEYASSGPRSGSCALSCHGQEHTAASSTYTRSDAAFRALMRKQASPFSGPARPAPVRK